MEEYAGQQETEGGEQVRTGLGDEGEDAKEKGDTEKKQLVILLKVHGCLLLSVKPVEANDTVWRLILQGVGSIILKSN